MSDAPYTVTIRCDNCGDVRQSTGRTDRGGHAQLWVGGSHSCGPGKAGTFRRADGTDAASSPSEPEPKSLADIRRDAYDAGVLSTTDGQAPQSFDDAAPGPIGANGQHKQYWVLSEAERAKGFVRPVRGSYRHVGRPGPRFPLRDLTDDERARSEGCDYVKYEEYPEPREASAIGRYWTQAQLDAIGRGCGTVTTMGRALAETYARQPGFYGSTMCVNCQTHLPVGRDGEFVWEGTDERVGT